MAMKVTERDLEQLPAQAARAFRSMKTEWQRETEVLADLGAAGHAMTMPQLEHWLKVLDERGFAQRRREGGHTIVRRAELVPVLRRAGAPLTIAAATATLLISDSSTQGLLTRLDDLLGQIGKGLTEIAEWRAECDRIAVELTGRVDALERDAAAAVPADVAQAAQEKAALWDELQGLLSRKGGGNASA